MMTANTTAEPAINDPAEVAYWKHRKVVRRRQLLAIVAVATLALGFVGWKITRHLTAAWWLETNQFVVLWGIEKDNWKQGGSTMVRFSSRQWRLFSSERPLPDLKFLTNLHRIEELDLAALADVRDADLENLGDLTELRRLNLARPHQPIYINSERGGLTDATLARIGQLTRLEELCLSRQKITDLGLKHLEGLRQLRELDLDGTEITDAGLECLKALSGLKTLDIQGTKVTALGVLNFEAARPLVKVLADTLASPLTPKPK